MQTSFRYSGAQPLPRVEGTVPLAAAAPVAAEEDVEAAVVAVAAAEVAEEGVDHESIDSRLPHAVA